MITHELEEDNLSYSFANHSQAIIYQNPDGTLLQGNYLLTPLKANSSKYKKYTYSTTLPNNIV
jgi:hypothetical protein